MARAFNQMADSLKKVEQLRKTMVLDVAHELRTPLTNMKGYLEALLDGVLPPPEKTWNHSRRRPGGWSAWSKTSSAWPRRMLPGPPFIREKSKSLI